MQASTQEILQQMYENFGNVSIILDKIRSQIYKNQVNGTRTENFHVCFFIIFDHHCQKPIFGRETGH